MTDQNLLRINWREAATGGLWLGLALCGVTVLSYLGRLHTSLSWMSSLLNFLLLTGFTLTYGRRMSLLYGAQGYSFSQSLGFSLKMMMFAGILAGLGQFIMQSYVDPQYYRDLIEQTLLSSGIDQAQVDLTMTAIIDQRNPFLMIVSGTLSMILYGGLIGLAVAAFIRRPADPSSGGTFHADEDPSNNTTANF